MKSELIQYAPLFTGLTEEERAALDAAFVAGQCAAGSTLLKAGERSEAIYLIGQGFVSLSTSSGQGLATLGPGSILGEASLLAAAPMDVSAKALADLSYWKLTDQGLRKLILQRPSIGIRLSRNFGRLVVQMEDYLAQRLSGTPELAITPPQTVQAIAKQLQPVDVSADSVIYRAGDMPGGLYLLESGLIELRSESRGAASGKDGARYVQAGRMFGGASLLTGKPALETATAREASTMWMLSTADFQTISAQQPGLRRALAVSVRSPLGREDRAQAVLWLAQMPMFREVPPDTLREVATSMQLQHVPAGERVYMMGDAGDALYLIESGEIEQTAQNASGAVEEIGRIGGGGYFGEMALLTGQMRSENASAIRHTNLWVLRKADLDELASDHPEIGTALSQGVATKLATGSSGSEVERLRMFTLLADLNAAELAQVAGHLEPMRYRPGEQIYRATGPADKLFLLEKGQVRIQPLGGGSWLLGPGEEFGERALLTNQPHNATAVAETDVDVWTLAKSNFDMLMGMYPGLALSMSRILTQRLTQMELGRSAHDAAPYAMEDRYAPSSTAMSEAATGPSRRSAYADTMPGAGANGNGGRLGFVDWFTGLTGFGKLRFALLVLLVIWLIMIATPFAVRALLQGSTIAASGADLGRSSLFNAVNAVYAVGSYELASKDVQLAELLAMADQQVPPTSTPTPPPTATPIPTNTPLPTSTPLPTNTPQPTAAAVAYAAPVVVEEPSPEPVVQAAAVAAPRAWDGRLDQLGARVDEAPAAPGQQYWRVSEARWENEQEAAGRHHIYVEVVDENGDRIVGQPVTVFWSDGNFTAATEDKNPPDYSFNYQMYAAGNAYDVKVEGMPSETFRGAGMGDIDRPNYGIHTAFYITFQRATK